MRNMVSEERVLPQSICVRCGKPSAEYRPFLCVKHDREMEKLQKKYSEFSGEIKYQFMDRKAPVTKILETLIKKCEQVQVRLEKDLLARLEKEKLARLTKKLLEFKQELEKENEE